MLLNAVIIILREVIEASLIISLFLAFSRTFDRSRLWLKSALMVGIIFSAIYAMNINTVSQWFDGVGQEVVNAGIQIVIYFVLLSFLVFAIGSRSSRGEKFLTILMVAGVALASVREGSEIMIYIHGFSSSPDLFQAVLLGSAIGAGIGISIGVCIYYFLITMPRNISVKVGYMLTLLVAGGMAIQSVQQLIQADWVMSQYPIWDTSMWISEHSVTGQLLYALIGYEATPTAIQVTVYAVAVSIIILSSIYSRKHYSRLQK